MSENSLCGSRRYQLVGVNAALSRLAPTSPSARPASEGSRRRSLANRHMRDRRGEVTMKTARNLTKAISFAALLVTALASPSLPARSQEAARYSKMAPVDQYLMTDRSAEIAMARSAAPPSISAGAEVMVLGRHGYETVVKGKNGFVCLVERSWMSPFDFAQFWNPKMRGPICFNPPAVRSILPLTFQRTELVLSGMSKDQIIEGIKAFDAKRIPAPEAGAKCSQFLSPRDPYQNFTFCPPSHTN